MTGVTFLEVEHIADHFDVDPALFFENPDDMFPKRTTTSGKPSSRWTMGSAGRPQKKMRNGRPKAA